VIRTDDFPLLEDGELDVNDVTLLGGLRAIRDNLRSGGQIGSSQTIDDAIAEIDRLRDRVDQLTGHLDWIGWSSDGVEKAKAEIQRLRSECALYLQERQAIRDLFPACLDEYGPTLLEAVKLFIEKEVAK
jgi:hypothetical protein